MIKRISSFTLLLVILLLSSGCSDSKSCSNTFFAMDTAMTFTLYGSRCNKALTECEAEIFRLEKIFSVSDIDSEVYMVNSSANSPVSVSAELIETVELATAFSKECGNSFDITISPIVAAFGFYTKTYRVPPQDEIDLLLKGVDFSAITLTTDSICLAQNQQIDLGGMLKGYLSDRILEILKKNKISKALISFGGSILCYGTKPDGSLWRVGVEDPLKKAPYLGVVSVADSSVVTSGNYERYFYLDDIKYHHIFDPKTGYPASSGLLSVTVIMADATLADMLSTALFVMGEEEAVNYWQSHNDFEMILVNDNQDILITPKLEDMFVLEEGLGYSLMVVQ